MPRDQALQTARSVWATTKRVLNTPAARTLLILIATYKLGEAMADVLFVPFVIDSGFSREDIGIWLGTYGMVASIAGSTAGGILAAQVSFTPGRGHYRQLAFVAHESASSGSPWLHPAVMRIIAVAAAEAFFGGALTTAMFALMMSRVDRRIGATHYTVLATVEVIGKGLITLAAGPIADATDYTLVFALAIVLSVAFLGLLAYTHRHREAVQT